MDYKVVIQGIDLCYNKPSHLGVQHQHRPEHDTFCISIFLHKLFIFFHDQNTIFANALLSYGVEITYLNLHHQFGCQCSFESGNQICLIQEVEHHTSIDIYNYYKWQ